MGTIPTTRIIGPKGLAIINTSDLKEYLAKGYVTETEYLAKQKTVKKEKEIIVPDEPIDDSVNPVISRKQGKNKNSKDK